MSTHPLSSWIPEHLGAIRRPPTTLPHSKKSILVLLPLQNYQAHSAMAPNSLCLTAHPWVFCSYLSRNCGHTTNCSPSPENELPFIFKQWQFPVKPADATMTNKSQGLAVQRVGIFLPQGIFAHGQLCIASHELVTTGVYPLQKEHCLLGGLDMKISSSAA